MLYTHDGVTFHADEVTAIAVAIEANIIDLHEVKRTRTDWSELRAGDFVIDVTPNCPAPDGVVVADHHQRSAKDAPEWQRTNGGPRLASAGWAWRQWGRSILAQAECPRIDAAWENIDRTLFWGIDAADNGELPPSDVPSYTISQAVSDFTDTPEMADEYFQDAVYFMRGILFRLIWAETRRQVEYAGIKSMIDKQWCDPVLMLEKGGAWKNVLLDEWDATDYIQVVVYPDATAPGVWRIQSAPGSKTDPFAMRCGAPTAMRGKRIDAGLTLGGCPVEFIHPAGFIGGVHAASAEDAYQAAREWIALSD